MRNGATNIFSKAVRPSAGIDAAWHVERRPTARLVWLFLAFALPLVLVAARLAYLQCWLVDDFVSVFLTTTESVEPIPSVDGRIVAADGRVLVEDVERHHVSVHYRWLEEPPNERWLTQQAMSRLGRPQRRSSVLLAQEKRQVLAAREQMWKYLRDLSGLPADELAAHRAAIQKCVERIKADVCERHVAAEPATEGDPVETDVVGDADARWTADRLWRLVKLALTTPPRREELEPIIVREELDYHPVIHDVPLSVRATIEAHPRWFPGVRVGHTTRRLYHESALAPHVVGNRAPLSEEELAHRKEQFGQHDPLDYRPGDRIGRAGVEAAYDSTLRGLRGTRRLVRNRYGEIVLEEVVRAPQPGGDIQLTLELSVQKKMEAALDAALAGTQHPDASDEDLHVPTGGCVVAIDVESGAVLAAASAPRFDFGATGTPDDSAWKHLSEDARHPLFHRATQMALPPGSVFKTLSAIALLESRRIDPDVRFDCQGYLERPDRFRCLIYSRQKVGHGPIDLTDALCRSCNVYFFHAAGIVGPKPIVDWAARFGIGHATGVDLPYERSGHLPDPEPTASGKNVARPTAWSVADTRALAIGQASLTVTPLQMARMMAAVANGGYLVTPFVARRAGPQAAEDDASSIAPGRQLVPGLSEGTLARVRAGLLKVVADPAGTAHQTVHLKGIAIAGKTGTAEVGKDKPDHAWFAGYVPADNPRIAFAVVLEHAGSGGKAAGPVARELVESLISAGVLEPARLTMRE